MEEAMAYFKCGETSVKELVNNGAISIVAGDSKLQQYDDLLADVRRDGKYHSVRSLVQPNDPEVRDTARVLVQAPDFITAAQEFVHSFTTYKSEVGDYWATPAETLAAFTKYREEMKTFGQAAPPTCDCDDMSILLCSILRNYIPADQVYCAFGLWNMGGKTTGHMWVFTEGEDGEDRIVEATAGPEKPGKGKYIMHGMFNDRYAFSTDVGLREFDLRTVEMAGASARR